MHQAGAKITLLNGGNSYYSPRHKFGGNRGPLNCLFHTDEDDSCGAVSVSSSVHVKASRHAVGSRLTQI